MENGLMNKKKSIFAVVFFAANRLQTISDRFLAGEEMTTKQWMLTLVLHRFGDYKPTLSEIAEGMDTSHQNAKQIARKLEQNGFIKIEPDTQDKRALRFSLTQKSHDFWADRDEKDDMFIQELFKDLSEQEIDGLFTGLMKFYESLNRLNENKNSE